MIELFRSMCCLMPVTIQGNRFICNKCGYTCDVMFEEDGKKKTLCHPPKHKMMTEPKVAK